MNKQAGIKKKIKCKWCGSTSIEILWHKQYGRNRKTPWDKTKKPYDYFIVHCYNCKQEYQQSKINPEWAKQNSNNRVPIIGYNFKKKYIHHLVYELNRLRSSSHQDQHKKQKLEYLSRQIGNYIEVASPMQINELIIIKNNKGAITIFKDELAFKRYKIFNNL